MGARAAGLIVEKLMDKLRLKPDVNIHVDKNENGIICVKGTYTNAKFLFIDCRNLNNDEKIAEDRIVCIDGSGGWSYCQAAEAGNKYRFAIRATNNKERGKGDEKWAEIEDTAINDKKIIIEVSRIKHNNERTIGKLKVDGGVINGYTLERDGIPEELETVSGSKKRIKAGTYDFIVNTYGKHPNESLRLLDPQVPGRSGILLHKGNTPGWSEGCLLGNRKEPIIAASNTVSDSLAFVKEILNYVKKREKEIKEKHNLKTVEKKIIIIQTNEIKD